MRYLGGKYRCAKEIAALINQYRAPGQLVWDAFCGGLSVAAALKSKGPVVASDIHIALISLYQAVQQGWDPPSKVTKEQFLAAKSLPDTDPLKAFCGFGCAFGGKYFESYAPARSATKGGPLYEMAASTRNMLRKDVPGLEFKCLSFFDICPKPSDFIFYLDPPYRGVATYSTGLFDHDAFESRVLEWSKYVDIFVSEYEFPHGKKIWEKPPSKSSCFANRSEALFYIPKQT